MAWLSWFTPTTSTTVNQNNDVWCGITFWLFNSTHEKPEIVLWRFSFFSKIVWRTEFQWNKNYQTIKLTVSHAGIQACYVFAFKPLKPLSCVSTNEVIPPTSSTSSASWVILGTTTLLAPLSPPHIVDSPGALGSSVPVPAQCCLAAQGNSCIPGSLEPSGWQVLLPAGSLRV